MKYQAALASFAAAVSTVPSPVRGAMTMYQTPSCNTVDIETCDVSTATPFSSLVASAAASNSRVVVPCNTCAVVDYTSYETVDLPEGLDVVGRLIFPSTANVMLNATSVFVQGMLDLETPDEGNRVTVNLYGGVEEVYFYPHDQCDGGYDPSCEHRENLGFKPFVVAGGK